MCCDFLLMVMQQMGVHKLLISDSKQGGLRHFLGVSKRLQQGDLLSPFLFLLIEIISKMVEAAVDNNRWKGFVVGRGHKLLNISFVVC